MPRKFFGALSPHVNLILVTNSYSKLSLLSTYSKQGHALLVAHRHFGHLAAKTRAALAFVD
jgi:hypothetical protein